MDENTQIDNIIGDITEIKTKITILESEINGVKQRAAVSEEQTKMIFNILKEIKDSIKIIAIKIDLIEKKPAQRWEELVKTVLGTVITVGGSILITWILLK